jgi:hypothetical protein
MYSRIVLGVIALLLAVNFALTDRSWKLASAPRVSEVEVLPEAPAFAPVRAATEAEGAALAYPIRGTPPPAAARPALKLGYAYREVSLFGMPLWAYPEPGLVTYLERPAAMQALVLSPEQVAALGTLTGRDYAQLGFPWYLHLWGWLLLVGIIVWTKARSIDIRRAEERELQAEASRSA